MSYQLVKTVNFGTSRSGLATVAWSLDGGSTWSTAGVSESPAGSGIYKATITFADDFTGALSWKTGEVSGQRFAAEDINPVGTVALPAVPPLGYGPIGTGSVAVNQDYPTDGNLTFRVSPTGPGIAGALVKAYLASEYTFNPNTAPIRGQTLTLDSGAWANHVNLDPGAYVVAFSAPGYEDTFVDLTVE